MSKSEAILKIEPENELRFKGKKVCPSLKLESLGESAITCAYDVPLFLLFLCVKRTAVLAG